MSVGVVPHVDFLYSSEVLLSIKKQIKELENVKIAVAYVKKKGYKSFSKSLKLNSLANFSKTSLKIRLIIGLSESHYITDYEPLHQLLKLKEELVGETERLQIHYISDPKFHSKMFLLSSSEKAALIVGSSNITQGGLKNNSEANLLLEAENSYPAMESAQAYFDWLWNNSKKLTNGIVNTYEKDKKEFCSKKQQIKKGHLHGKLPSKPPNKKRELTLFIDNSEFPLSSITSYCKECGTAVKVPYKWLTYFNCGNHPGNRIKLVEKKGEAIEITTNEHKFKNVQEIDAACPKKLKDGTTCKNLFSLKPDFTHQICKDCYYKRKKANEPCYKIRLYADDKDSFFYDVGRKSIYEGK